jgi:uncharacterized membrane protein YdbT with pleckstrin-like domain
MAYYTKVLQSDETVRYAGKLHWIIYKSAIILAALTCGLALAASTQSMGGAFMVMIVVFLLLALSAYLFFVSWFRRVTTEIIVTDKRIIHKTGWIARRTEEINISKVETVDVRQGIGGRILGYGTVIIKGVGGGWEPLHLIATPLELRNAILVG